jgi:hypothetical protein
MDTNPEIKHLRFEAPKDLKYYRLTYKGLTFQIVTGIILGKKQYILRDTSGNECVNVSVDDENKLYLSTLQYRPACTVDHPMKKGESTIIMLKGLLKFVIEHEPQHESVLLYDISEFDCALVGQEYTITISLPRNNFILYGKTWYQRHFQAEITDKVLREQMDKSLIKLNELVKNNDLYNDILSKIQTILKRNKYPKSKELHLVINTCFENALVLPTTWMKLFYDIFSSDGFLSLNMGKSNNYSCTLFYHVGMLFNIFDIPTFIDIPMKLSSDTIKSYDGNVEYEEDKSPAIIYKGGSKTIRSYPYYRDYGHGITRKMRSLPPFKTTHSIRRYFSELPWKNKKTRSNRNKDERTN